MYKCIRTEYSFKETAIHGFLSWIFSRLDLKLLERNGEVVIGLIFGEIDSHAGINVTIVCSIFFHFISNILECFPHAILDHFLFRFFCFSKLFQKNRYDFGVGLLVGLIIELKEFGLDLVFILVELENKLVDKFPE